MPSFFNRLIRRNPKKLDGPPSSNTQNNPTTKDSKKKKKPGFFSGIKKFSNRLSGFDDVTERVSQFVSQHWWQIYYGIGALVVVFGIIFGIGWVLQTRTLLLEQEAVTHYLREKTETEDDCMLYAIARSEFEVLNTFVDHLKDKKYVYRGDEQGIHDMIVDLYKEDTFGTLFYGLKTLGKTTSLAMVLFHMSSVMDYTRSLWWLYDEIVNAEDYLTTNWMRQSNYDKLKSLASSINKELIETHFEVVPLLQSKQMDTDKYRFRIKGVDRQSLPLNISKQVYFVTFEVSLKDDERSGEQQIYESFNAPSAGKEYKFVKIRDAARRLDRDVIFWIHLKAGGRYGSTEREYTQLVDFCRILSEGGSTIRCVIEASKSYPGLSGEVNRRYKLFEFKPITDENVNVFAQRYNENAPILKDQEKHVSGGRPWKIFEMVDNGIQYVLDNTWEKVTKFGYAEDALSVLKSVSNEICKYSNRFESYLIYKNDLERYVRDTEQMETISEMLGEVGLFDFHPNQKAWIFNDNAFGFLFCEKL